MKNDVNPTIGMYAAAATTATPDVLIVSADPILADDVLRLVAAVGRQAVVVPTLTAAGRLWVTARLVLVDGAIELELVRERGGVVMVTYDGSSAAPVWHAAHALGAPHVAVLPAAEAWLLEQLDDVGSAARAPLIAFIGARGGAGATTTAVATAVRAAESGRSVLLIDGDPLGGGIDLVLGAEDVAGIRWRDLAQRTGRLPTSLLTASLPKRHGVHVLSHDRRDELVLDTPAVAAVVESARRAFDVVVVDLARTVNSVSVVTLSAADAAVLVVPREIRAVAAATCVARQLPGGLDPMLVTRAPAPGGLAALEVARILALPLLVDVDFDKSLAVAAERGDAPGLLPRSPLGRLGTKILNAIGMSVIHQVAA